MNSGDGCVRKPLQLPQGEHHPLPFGELLGDVPHQLAEVGQLQGPLRLAAPVGVGEAEHLLLGIGGRLLVGGAPLAPAQLVMAGIDRDAADPASEVEAVVDAVDGPDEVEEGLLDEVLDDHVIADVAQADEPHSSVMAAEELVEGEAVALPVGVHQLDIRALTELAAVDQVDSRALPPLRLVAVPHPDPP